MNKFIYITIGLFMLCTKTFATVNKPYLEVPTPTSIYIDWKSDSEKDFILYYGTDPNNMIQSLSASSQIWSDTGYNNNYIYNPFVALIH